MSGRIDEALYLVVTTTNHLITHDHDGPDGHFTFVKCLPGLHESGSHPQLVSVPMGARTWPPLS
jgi:hypothetical protein